MAKGRATRRKSFIIANSWIVRVYSHRSSPQKGWHGLYTHAFLPSKPFVSILLCPKDYQFGAVRHSPSPWRSVKTLLDRFVCVFITTMAQDHSNHQPVARHGHEVRKGVYAQTFSVPPRQQFVYAALLPISRMDSDPAIQSIRSHKRSKNRRRETSRGRTPRHYECCQTQEIQQQPIGVYADPELDSRHLRTISYLFFSNVLSAALVISMACDLPPLRTNAYLAPLAVVIEKRYLRQKHRICAANA